MYQICPRCLRKVYIAEEKQVDGKAWHSFCFSCRLCKRLLEDENDAVRDNDGHFYCSECFERHNELELTISGDDMESGAVGSQIISCLHAPTTVTTGLPSAITAFYARLKRRSASLHHETEKDDGGYFGKPFPLYPDNVGASTGTPPKCHRCGNKVFHAEARQVEGRLYHDCCFVCLCCHKPLDATSINVCRGHIYCKTCYLRIVGPNGYGFGVGAGTLQSF